MSLDINDISDLKDEQGRIDSRKIAGNNVTGAVEPCSARQCYRVRIALAHGATLAGHCEHPDAPVTDGAEAHARGGCHHDASDHPAPPLRHGWYVDPGRGRTGSVSIPRAGMKIGPSDCRRLRERLLALDCRRELADAEGYARSSVLRHVAGRCDHDETTVGHPTLAHGWHVPSDKEGWSDD